MCLPWNHKWETIITTEEYPKYTILGRPYTKYTKTKRCTHCGKEIVRKYRV